MGGVTVRHGVVLIGLLLVACGARSVLSEGESQGGGPNRIDASTSLPDASTSLPDASTSLPDADTTPNADASHPDAGTIRPPTCVEDGGASVVLPPCPACVAGSPPMLVAQVEPAHNLSPSIVLAGESLYIGTMATTGELTDTITKTRKCGGPATTVACGLSYVINLAADEKDVYYAAQSGVGAIAIDGGARRALWWTTPNEMPRGLALDPANVYFGTLPIGYVRRVPKAGGAAVDLTTSENTSGLALAGERLFLAGIPVGSVAKDGGPVDEIDPREGLAIATDATTLAYAVYRSSLFVRPLAGGPSIKISGDDDAPISVALADDAIYFSTYGASRGQAKDGAIKKAPRNGGPVVVVADNQRFPYPVLVDATCAYWATVDGRIWRAPR